MADRRGYQTRIRRRRRIRRWRNTTRSHIRLVLRPPYDGMRCHMCRDVPPQPGEIMEEESNADFTGA